MKLISWNVNGLRACVKKGFEDIFKTLDADFFCIQETKLQKGQIDLSFENYRSYWNYAEKKGYSGTAIYSKHKPLSVSYGINIEEHDHEGRVICLEMPDFYLVCVYVPNTQDQLRRLDYRMQWEDDFRDYLLGLSLKGLSPDTQYDTSEDFPLGKDQQGKAKPVILCGDLNVAHQEIDLKNPKTNTRNAGFTIEERTQFSSLLSNGFIDSWRFLNPEAIKYSWWSYRANARANNTGWRIDYFVVAQSLQDRIKSAEIHNDIFGSDHCPVELVID